MKIEGGTMHIDAEDGDWDLLSELARQGSLIYSCQRRLVAIGLGVGRYTIDFGESKKVLSYRAE